MLQVIKPIDIFTSSYLRFISSVTLIPVAYISSSIALSLMLLMLVPSVALRKLSTSSIVKTVGIFFSTLGDLMPAAGSSLILPLFFSYEKNAFVDASTLDIVGVDFPICPRYIRYELIIVVLILDTSFIPCPSSHAESCFRSLLYDIIVFSDLCSTNSKCSINSLISSFILVSPFR